MSTDTLIRRKPDPLPDTMDEFERIVSAEPNLNDRVQAIHIMLYNEDAAYRRFLNAVWDEDAVEGSLAADNLEAASMIRAKAKAIGDDVVAPKKKATIVKSLNVVLRRWHGLSRKDRRQTVSGEIVPGNGE